MPQSTSLPKISIVIPAYNEATMLPHCLAALNRQDYRGEYEIIVVDNASTDATAAIALEHHATVIFEPTKGVVYARIAGFSQATGSIIASTDADTIVPTDWLSRIEQELRDTRYAGVVGAYKLCNTNTLSKRLVQQVIPLFRAVDRLCGAHFAGANFAVLRTAYDAVGGFYAGLQTGEDLDLSYRLRQNGFELKVAYDILVETSARRLNEGFWYTFIHYILINWFSLVFLHHSYLQNLSTVREEPGELEDVA